MKCLMKWPDGFSNPLDSPHGIEVMNMIVGVLVEVVGIVAAAEQEASTRKSLLESLRDVSKRIV